MMKTTKTTKTQKQRLSPSPSSMVKRSSLVKRSRGDSKGSKLSTLSNELPSLVHLSSVGRASAIAHDSGMISTLFEPPLTHKHN
jgi:hypothetical protein